MTTEMRHASMLDVIEGRLLAGDLDGAQVAITRGEPLESLHGSMAWHHRQRYWVQVARFVLATGDATRARESATRAILDAKARGSRRYELFATIVEARAAAALREPVDHDALDEALNGLETCGGLEAWHVTAELAAATGVERWRRDAERRAGALVANAGDHGEVLRTYIASRFTALQR